MIPYYKYIIINIIVISNYYKSLKVKHEFCKECQTKAQEIYFKRLPVIVQGKRARRTMHGFH